MGKTIFKIFLLFFINFQTETYSNNKLILSCTNIENNSMHSFIIYSDYKVVNVLPNGYEFDYIIENESPDSLVSYFYQINDNLIKKFVLSFNLKENILYDEMYEGNDKRNLILKDKKIFKCEK
tara:strand:+ start:464 stop:832 length:369 start_codon:yes stop_codon:yes gene_type:complete